MQGANKPVDDKRKGHSGVGKGAVNEKLWKSLYAGSVARADSLNTFPDPALNV
jgi:hypothetical protein